MSKMLYVDYYLEKDQKEYLDNLLGLYGTIKDNGKVTYYLEEKQKEAIDALLNKEGIIYYDDPNSYFSNGCRYFFIDSSGDIMRETWDNDPVDKARMDIGNAFKTGEEAEFASERLKVLNKLRRLSDDDQEWNNRNDHYYIGYCFHSDKFEVWSNSNVILSHGYWFKSKRSAETAIKTIGEDKLKKYVFNIKTCK